MPQLAITFRFEGDLYIFATDDRAVWIANEDKDKAAVDFTRLVAELKEKRTRCTVDVYEPLGRWLRIVRRAGALCHTRAAHAPPPLGPPRQHTSETEANAQATPCKGEWDKRVLVFDPTPAGLVGDRSFRRRYKNEWAKVRKRRFASSDFRCECCGEERGDARRLDGHEVYSFPDAETVRLERVWFLCRLCHDAVHLERTRWRAQASYVADVEHHYRRVNGGLSQENVQADFASALRHSAKLQKLYGARAAPPKIDYGILREIADAAEDRKIARQAMLKDQEAQRRCQS